jgi:photosystem II stability/assembly factor-like uncharacterized protein
VQHTGPDVELRGIAVRDESHAWAGGAKGTVLRTKDGEKWEPLRVPGGEELDFRDLEAPSASTVVLMSAGPGDKSKIFVSADGGDHWTLAHTNPDEKGFYDAIAFFDEKVGLVVGDPVGGKFVVRKTEDGGATWSDVAGLEMPPARENEGAFAASGTCLTALYLRSDAWFVTGGAGVSRVFHSKDRGKTWTVAESPVKAAGNASSGLFSIAFVDALSGFVVGGDYKQPALAALNGARTEDGGKTWIPAPIGESGFYSAVRGVPLTNGELVAVGPTGSATSTDLGRTWKKLNDTPLNAAAFAGPRAGWGAGAKGTVVRIR